MSEMAVVSSRKSRLKVKAESGHAGYRAALRTARKPNNFLSDIQIGITLIGILAGAFGEATISENMEVYLRTMPLVAGFEKVISIGTVVILTTTLSIVFGELVPKRIALTGPERIASLFIFPVKGVTFVFRPLSMLFTAVTDIVMNMLPLRQVVEPPVSEEEIRAMVREGEEFGLFRREQRDMIDSIFELHETKLSRIMTARPDIRYIEAGDPISEIRDRIIDYSSFVYIPVCRNGIDNITGVLKTQRVIKKLLRGQLKSINSFVEKPLFVPSVMSPIKVLEQFRAGGTRIAFVIDEFGGVMGLVTLEDIIEEIVGKIPFVRHMGEPGIIRRKDGSYLVDGLIPIDEFLHNFPSVNEEHRKYNTLAGLIISRAGRIPSTGDVISHGGLNFEVVSMNGNRIEKVIVKKG